NKGQKEVIPIIQPETSYEYFITLSIKKLTITNKTIIGLLQGNGEPDIYAIKELYNNLSALYEIENIELNNNSDIPKHIKTLLIISPKDSFSQNNFNTLDNFLRKGNNIFIAYNSVDANPEAQYAFPVYNNFQNWLKQKGIIVKNNFIIDKNCMPIVFTQNQSGYPVKSTINFPLIPILTKFSNHPVNTGIQSVVFEFASQCLPNNKNNVKFIPLIKTSDKSGIINPPFQFDLLKNWTDTDFPLSNITVAAILEGKIVGNKNSKIVFISDGDFVINGVGQNTIKINEDNIHLTANIIDWLSGSTELFHIRTKEIKYRPLISLPDKTKNIIKYFNFIFPILLIIIYGIIRQEKNKMKKN
ncbi:MAG: hypothetical protein A2X12_10200, partial [Bacteroidetes bacterium GWE2_29_8]